MSINKNQPNHDDIMELLPWFVNQTLDEQQASIVADHLKHCEQCQSEVKFLGAMNEMVKTDTQTSYRENACVDKDLKNVMARIDSDELQTKPIAKGGSFFQQILEKITDFLPSLPVGMQGATAIAGVLIAVMGFQVFYGEPSDDFTVLSSSEINDSAFRLSIEIAPSMDQDEDQAAMQALFDKHGQEVGFEAGAKGAYVIKIQKPMKIDELNALVMDLNDQALVKRVEILP